MNISAVSIKYLKSRQFNIYLTSTGKSFKIVTFKKYSERTKLFFDFISLISFLMQGNHQSIM